MGNPLPDWLPDVLPVVALVTVFALVAYACWLVYGGADDAEYARRVISEARRERSRRVSRVLQEQGRT